MPYYKIVVSTSEILEAKDENDATKQMTSIIGEFKPDDFDWEVEDVTESPFFTPYEPGIGFPLIE